VHVARSTTPVYRDLLVLFDNRLVCRTVVVEVIHHHRERLLRESLVADKELLRARRTTRSHLHMEVARLRRLFRQADGVILPVVRPVVRIYACAERARRHGGAGHAAIRVKPQGPLLPFEVVGALDHDRNRLVGVVARFVEIENVLSKRGYRESHRPEKGHDGEILDKRVLLHIPKSKLRVAKTSVNNYIGYAQVTKNTKKGPL